MVIIIRGENIGNLGDEQDSYIYPEQIKKSIFKYLSPWIIILAIGIICYIYLFKTDDPKFKFTLFISFMFLTFFGSLGIIIYLINRDLENHKNVGIRNPFFKWTLISIDNIMIFLTIVLYAIDKIFPDFSFALFIISGWFIIPLFIGSGYSWYHRPIKKEKYLKYLSRKKKGVSPVVAILLMIGITVVLASVLYVPQPPPSDYYKYTQRAPSDLPKIDDDWEVIKNNIYIDEPTKWKNKKLFIKNNSTLFINDKLWIDNSIIIFHTAFERFYSYPFDSSISDSSIYISKESELILNNSRITVNEIRHKWNRIKADGYCSIINSTIEYSRNGIFLNSNNINVKDSQFKNCDHCIYMKNDFKNITIENNNFYSNNKCLVATGDGSFSINGNLFDDSYKCIEITSNKPSKKININSNTFKNSFLGVDVHDSDLPEIIDCNFIGNSIGIQLNRVWSNKWHLNISSCNFQNNNIALNLYSIPNITVVSCTFENNNIGAECDFNSKLYLVNCVFQNNRDHFVTVNDCSYVYITHSNVDVINYLYRNECGTIYKNGDLLQSNFISDDGAGVSADDDDGNNFFLVLGIIILIVIIINIYFIFKYYSV